MEEAWLGSRPPAALTLVVVPKQLIEHWREQAGTHAPSLRVRVVETAADALGTFSEVDLVITSFARLSQESELGIRSPVLQVRWLRVVVDEGHAVAQGAQSNYKQLLSKLSCERKWAMTGTPAKLTSVPEGVGNLRRLLECIGIHVCCRKPPARPPAQG
jgi:SNF2 family DNA or RNA helicase